MDSNKIILVCMCVHVKIKLTFPLQICVRIYLYVRHVTELNLTFSLYFKINVTTDRNKSNLNFTLYRSSIKQKKEKVKDFVNKLV